MVGLLVEPACVANSEPRSPTTARRLLVALDPSAPFASIGRQPATFFGGGTLDHLIAQAAAGPDLDIDLRTTRCTRAHLVRGVPPINHLYGLGTSGRLNLDSSIPQADRGPPNR